MGSILPSDTYAVTDTLRQGCQFKLQHGIGIDALPIVPFTVTPQLKTTPHRPGS